MKAFFKDHPQRIFFYSGLVLVAILTIIGAWYGIQQNKKSDVLAVVAGAQITQKDLNEKIYSIDFAGTPEKPSTKPSKEEKEGYLGELVENAIIAKVASEQNISVSDEETTKLAKERNANFDQLGNTQKNISLKMIRAELLKSKVTAAVLGYREGQYLLFRFDKYFKDYQETLGVTASDQKVQEQKAYAEKLATDYYNKINQKVITFAQAQIEAPQDATIGTSAFSPLRPNFLGTFTKDEAEKGLNMFSSTEFVNAVTPLAEGQLTKPFVIKRKTNDGSEKEYTYVIALIEKVKGAEVLSYDNWLAKQKDRLEVTTYEDNIASLLQKISPTASAACVAYADNGAAEATNVLVAFKFKNSSGTYSPYYNSSNNEQNPEMLGIGLNREGGYISKGVSKTSDFCSPATAVQTGSAHTLALSNLPGVMSYYAFGYNINCSSSWYFDFSFPKWGALGNTKGVSAGTYRGIDTNGSITGVPSGSGDAGVFWLRSDMGSYWAAADASLGNGNYEKRMRLTLVDPNNTAHTTNGKVLTYTVAYDPVWNSPTHSDNVTVNSITNSGGSYSANGAIIPTGQSTNIWYQWSWDTQKSDNSWTSTTYKGAKTYQGEVDSSDYNIPADVGASPKNVRAVLYVCDTGSTTTNDSCGFAPAGVSTTNYLPWPRANVSYGSSSSGSQPLSTTIKIAAQRIQDLSGLSCTMSPQDPVRSTPVTVTVTASGFNPSGWEIEKSGSLYANPTLDPANNKVKVYTFKETGTYYFYALNNGARVYPPCGTATLKPTPSGSQQEVAP